MRPGRLTAALGALALALLLGGCPVVGPNPLPTPQPQPTTTQVPPVMSWHPPESVTSRPGTVVYVEETSYGSRQGPWEQRLDTARILTRTSPRLFVLVTGIPDIDVGFEQPRDRFLTGHFGPVQNGDADTYVTYARGGSGCSDDWSEYVIDALEYTPDGDVAHLEARFTNRCPSRDRTAWGYVRIDASDPTVPPYPEPLSDPTFAWQPAPGSVPATGDFYGLWNADGTPIGVYGPGQFDPTTSGYGDFFSLTELVEDPQPSHYLRFSGPWNLQPMAEGGYDDPGDGRSHATPDIALVFFDGSCWAEKGWMAIDRFVVLGEQKFGMAGRFEATCPDGRVVHGAFRFGLGT